MQAKQSTADIVNYILIFLKFLHQPDRNHIPEFPPALLEKLAAYFPPEDKQLFMDACEEMHQLRVSAQQQAQQSMQADPWAQSSQGFQQFQQTSDFGGGGDDPEF